MILVEFAVYKIKINTIVKCLRKGLYRKIIYWITFRNEIF